MTECERLVAEGLFDESFFEEEIRDEFYVGTKRKKVWAISIDLLLQVEKICKELGINYFVICGTNIGAVRHKGFIPWDDDIDIGMLREDYNKFVAVAQDKFVEPYFLQTTLTDDGFYNRQFIRLRNSRTTGISPCDQKKRINNGIFLDIFPLDGYEEKMDTKMFLFGSKIKSATAWNYCHYDMVQRVPTRKIMKFLTPLIIPGGVKRYFTKHNKRATALSKKYNRYVGIMYSFFGYKTEKLIWDKECFSQTVFLPFENIEVPVPAGYDKVLTITYGDYMKFPPKEVRGKHHDIEFEPDVDYKTYCAEKYGVTY